MYVEREDNALCTTPKLILATLGHYRTRYQTS